MENEHCWNCNRPIQDQEALVINGQVLCQDCYMRTTDREPGEPVTSKFRDALDTTVEIDESDLKEISDEKALPSSEIDLLKKIADTLNKQEKREKDKKDNKRDEAIVGVIVFVVIVLTIWGYHSCSKRPEARDGGRGATEREATELRRSEAEYARAKADLEAVRAWAEVELSRSNTILQDIVNSVVNPTGELMMPEKQAQACIDKAMQDCEIRGRIIDAKVELFEQKAREAGNRVIEAKRKARTAEVEVRR